MTKKMGIDSVFGIIFCLWLISRIFVLTGNYELPINPTIIQIIYVLCVIALLLLKTKGCINKHVFRNKNFMSIIIILILHTVLWGKVFVNSLMKELTVEHFNPQIMFVVTVILTAIAVLKFDYIDKFVKISFYTISFILLYQLIKNFSQLNLSNIANIMSKTERSRANFGFGHYNTLGGACLCNIILWSLIKKNNMEKYVTTVFLIISIIMLLCSASRSSFTGLILYVAVIIFEKILNMNLSKKVRASIAFLKITLFLGIIFFAFNLDFKELLVQSQRSLIFEYAIPTYLNSGRILQGLGYVSNTAYGTHITPYTTYWLDNGYIYILVSTGLMGFGLICYILLIWWNKFSCNENILVKKQIFPILVVYLYTALFEANLLNSGSITNYIYIVIFLVCIYKLENKKIKN